MRTAPRRAVGLIGHGAIGRVVADALARGDVPGHRLAGVLVRSTPPSERAVSSVDELIEHSDVVVEAASQAAVAEYGPRVKEAGRDLLVLSIGALVDDALLSRLSGPEGGRLLLSTGACGGIDVLRAAMLLQPLDEVELRTSKPSRALIRDWMELDVKAALAQERERVCAFGGSAREAVSRFPESANLSGLLALATIGFDAVAVELWGEPGRSSAGHRISARGAAGIYEFSIENELAPDNPRTSAVTAYAALRYLVDAGSPVVPGC